MNNKSEVVFKRGDVYFANLNPVVGCEQKGIRPVLIVQNDIGNIYSPTTIIVPITGKISKELLPTHVLIKQEYRVMSKKSVILVEQIRTIDKHRLFKKICTLDEKIVLEVDKALRISLSL